MNSTQSTTIPSEARLAIITQERQAYAGQQYRLGLRRRALVRAGAKPDALKEIDDELVAIEAVFEVLTEEEDTIKGQVPSA